MSNYPSTNNNDLAAGHLTREEIFHQPDLWPTTLDRVRASGMIGARSKPQPVVITGAGSSAYAASAIATSWPESRAIPTTDLLVMSEKETRSSLPEFVEHGLLISIARSGQSPESAAVVAKIQRHFPAVEHLVITCNAEGRLARTAGVKKIVLDPRTNDRSLVMTSSFSNLVLAGLCLRHAEALASFLPDVCSRVENALPRLDRTASLIAGRRPARVAVLASGDLKPLAKELALKVLEMTGGSVFALPETFLGLRHGPMSFLRPDSLVLCLLSADPGRRQYEEDLLEELQEKRLGHVVSTGLKGNASAASDTNLPSETADLPDYLRVPFEAPFGQLLAFHLSLGCGLDPDNPSPSGVINRVVQGFRIHDDAARV